MAADVAWRFRAYDSYGGNPATARRAIRRRCPDCSPKQIENAFTKASALYDSVDDLVRDNASLLWAIHKTDDTSWRRHFDRELQAQFPGFRVSTLRGMVVMNFYYWHLR